MLKATKTSTSRIYVGKKSIELHQGIFHLSLKLEIYDELYYWCNYASLPRRTRGTVNLHIPTNVLARITVKKFKAL